mmetsp:Transcript_8304/g.15645  ORF Transcript_8304/g.15645 Transcript_8304/m.15645 type:complete len:453 (+) Transcript_8304:155-1513(+)
MNADILAMLNGSIPVSNRRSTESQPKTLLSFKAGKMIAERKPNGRYLVTPDPRRGTLEVNWTASSASSGVLKIEWRDRRTRSVVDSLTIFPEDDCTYSKVDTGPGREKDRVYLLQYGNASERRFFFWMQEKEEGNQDEEFCNQINTFMADPEEAAAVARGETTKDKPLQRGNASAVQGGDERRNDISTRSIDQNTLQSIMQELGSSGSTAGTGSGVGSQGNRNASQVDALSNILENLGIPQTSSAASGSVADSSTTTNAVAPAATASATVSAPSTNRGLTLSDLQGAMAGLATTSPIAASASPPNSVYGIQRQLPPGPPLSQVVTAENVLESGILDNEQVKQKLISLLPENQQSEERLLENLRSPQVRQCLNALSAALCDDQGTSMDNFNSILANFQLRPEDGAIAMMAGNPIQAFLDCVLKSVQRENEQQQKEDEETKQDGTDDNDAEMKE